jgi:hypothetical protein
VVCRRRRLRGLSGMPTESSGGLCLSTATATILDGRHPSILVKSASAAIGSVVLTGSFVERGPFSCDVSPAKAAKISNPADPEFGGKALLLIELIAFVATGAHSAVVAIANLFECRENTFRMWTNKKGKSSLQRRRPGSRYTKYR